MEAKPINEHEMLLKIYLQSYGEVDAPHKSASAAHWAAFVLGLRDGKEKVFPMTIRQLVKKIAEILNIPDAPDVTFGTSEIGPQD